MTLIVAINKSYHSYFSPKYIGTLNKKKEFRKIKEEEKALKGKLGAYQSASELNKIKQKKFYARDLMSKVTYSISQNENLESATKKMGDLAIHHLLVLEDKELVGLISDRDILKNIQSPKKLVKEVMNEKVLLCNSETEVRLIAKVLYEEQISSIVVANDDHHPLGIITRSDLLNFIVSNMPLDVWA
ncbi:MAG: putative transcriptional regulator [Bacteriovoracaceae bacterium]|jgi:predicted transcriptional regulator